MFLTLGSFLGRTADSVDVAEGTPSPAADSAEQPAPVASPEHSPAGSDVGVPPQASPTPVHTFEWPVGGWISQGMTAAHPGGVDIAVEVGEPVRSVRAGQVIYSGGNPCCSYGYYIIVRHDDERWTSLYGHLSAALLEAGDRVRQGELLGLSGDTGMVDGPHLHFELRLFGAPVDPFDFLQPPRRPPVLGQLVTAPEQTPELSSEGSPTSEEGSPTSERSDVTFAEQALEIGAAWMQRQEGGAYAVDLTSCTAVPVGPNWSVSCGATLEGCVRTSICRTTLTVCVFEQPLLVAPAC